jgi:hypothetical protein
MSRLLRRLFLPFAAAALVSVPFARAEEKPGDAPKPADPAPAPAPAPAAPAPVKGEPVRLKDALAELGRLKDYLRTRKADPEDVKGSLDAVAKAYHNLAKNLVTGPDGATVEQDDASFAKAKEAFWGEAEDLFVKALEYVRVKPNTQNNVYDDVNVKAAQILGLLGATNPKAPARISKKIVDTLETKVFKAKDHTPPTALYDETFKAIALLNDHKTGLFYVQEEWIKYSATAPDPDIIKAAYESLAHFKNVPGLKRYEIVDKTVRTFTGVETAAERQSDAKERLQKQVWDKIKGPVIKVLQDYALQPKNAKGALLNTVGEFQNWFRDNDNPKKAPWVDPKLPPSPPPTPPPGSSPPSGR